MAKIPFPYLPNTIAATQTQPATTAWRPQRPATITAANGKSVRFLVLLDTGADACVFPLSTALLLGLDILNLRKAFTAGVGSQANVTVYAPVHINLGNGVSFITEAGFTPGLEALGIGLLGQAGFFETYNVEFRLADKLYIIEPIASAS